ncbi:MAG: hypothetical protein KA248_13525 [Kiritimatiellae bacterium]|nr:hypothetical protein [Kiritimatiellia bacterium]
MTSRDERLRREEALREKHISPETRARHVADMTEWADAQQAVRRNTREFCLAHQRRLLRSSVNDAGR